MHRLPPESHRPATPLPYTKLFRSEEHPILNMYDDRDRGGPPQPDESYFRAEPYRSDNGLDYWANADYAARPCYWNFHKLSDVVMGVVRAGFALEDFEEFPHNIGTRDHFENRPQQLPLSRSEEHTSELKSI